MPDRFYPAPLSAVARRREWERCWRILDLVPEKGLLLELESSWSELGRAYHDARHLGECLALWSLWGDAADEPETVALAIWFHDAVYDTHSTDNELKSAIWAARALISAGGPAGLAQRVFDLVMATRHGAPAHGTDAQLLADIDLAILGSPSARFDEYNIDVRREYEWVPGHLYNAKRTQILEGFERRAPIFQTAPAFALLESQAHLNLQAAIVGLRA